MTTVLPQPSDRLIGYLDILGWSEIVRDEKRAGDVATAMLEVQAEKDTWARAGVPLVESIDHYTAARDAPRGSRRRRLSRLGR